MTEALKPCPFCGGEGRVEHCRCGYYVKCLDCGIAFDDESKADVTGCFEPFATEQEAVSAWNSEVRYDTPQPETTS